MLYKRVIMKCQFLISIMLYFGNSSMDIFLRSIRIGTDVPVERYDKSRWFSWHCLNFIFFNDKLALHFVSVCVISLPL